MSNQNAVAKGRKFAAYIISQFFTAIVVVILIFKASPAEIVALGQVYVGYQALITGGYIGFNVYQKKVTNGQPKAEG